MAGSRSPGIWSAPSNAGSVYDPATGTWAPLPAMPTLRHSAAATGLNGLLYVMGGYSGNGPVVWADVYNPATGNWRILPDMPTGRGSPGAGAINGKVYVAGGQGDITLTTNQVYTP